MKSFKVLSIDGGGILGMFSAKVLELVELELQSKHGNLVRIADFVDLLCGTSTGGILALAIANRIPAADIVKFYENHGPTIFKRSTGLFASCRQLFLGGKFKDRELKKRLTDVFGDKVIGNSHCLLCIPAFDITHCTYAVFKFDHKEGNLNRHNKIPIVDVALATSAAPTYFPLVQISAAEGRQFVDGGVWANNPSLVGFLEAAQYFVGPGKQYHDLRLLSIATPGPSVGNRPNLPPYRGFVSWARGLFELGMIGQSEFADVFLKEIQDKSVFPIEYNRIASHNISTEHSRLMGMDLAEPSSLALLRQYGADAYYSYRRNVVQHNFWSDRKTYITQMLGN